MPLKRTPPKTPLTNKTCSSTLEVTATPNTDQSILETNLSNFEDTFVTTRRKYDNLELNHFMREMKEMLSTAASQNQQKISSLESSIKEVISQNSGILDSLNFISRQYDDLNDKFQALLAERKEDRVCIRKLEDKITHLEHLLHSTKVELKNIPKNDRETKEELCSIIQKTAQTLDVLVQPSDLKNVYRTTNKTTHASVIVAEFTSTLTKEKLIKNARRFSKTKNGTSLNTSLIGLTGPAKPIYISEYLTPYARNLFYLSRKFAKENGYKYCWTSYGKIYMRQNEGKQALKIDNEEALKKLLTLQK